MFGIGPLLYCGMRIHRNIQYMYKYLLNDDAMLSVPWYMLHACEYHSLLTFVDYVFSFSKQNILQIEINSIYYYHVLHMTLCLNDFYTIKRPLSSSPSSFIIKKQQTPVWSNIFRCTMWENASQYTVILTPLNNNYLGWSTLGGWAVRIVHLQSLYTYSHKLSSSREVIKNVHLQSCEIQVSTSNLDLACCKCTFF